MFPDKQSMKRRATQLWALLMIAPVVYFFTAYQVVVPSGTGLSRSGLPVFLLPVFIVIAIANIATIAYSQSSRFLRMVAKKPLLDPDFQALSLGSILAEAISIYGFVLTLLSGSLLYSLGFTVASWTLLVLVRMRFEANLNKTAPETPGQV